MRFHSDPAKSAANLQKHGYDLADAKAVIESGETVTFEDRRYAYDEARFVTLGMLKGSVVFIVTAETETEIRVISMRKADKYEQKIYFKNS